MFLAVAHLEHKYAWPVSATSRLRWLQKYEIVTSLHPLFSISGNSFNSASGIAYPDSMTCRRDGFITFCEEVFFISVTKPVACWSNLISGEFDNSLTR